MESEINLADSLKSIENKNVLNISHSDVEDGEISEANNVEYLKKMSCLDFQQGHCTLGKACRLLHLSDKGLYTMFDSNENIGLSLDPDSGSKTVYGPDYNPDSCSKTVYGPDYNPDSCSKTVYGPINPACQIVYGPDLKPTCQFVDDGPEETTMAETEWDQTLKEAMERVHKLISEIEPPTKRGFSTTLQNDEDVQLYPKSPPLELIYDSKSKDRKSAYPKENNKVRNTDTILKSRAIKNANDVPKNRVMKNTDTISKSRVVRSRSFKRCHSPAFPTNSNQHSSSHCLDPCRRSKSPPIKRKRRVSRSSSGCSRSSLSPPPCKHVKRQLRSSREHSKKHRHSPSWECSKKRRHSQHFCRKRSFSPDNSKKWKRSRSPSRERRCRRCDRSDDPYRHRDRHLSSTTCRHCTCFSRSNSSSSPIYITMYSSSKRKSEQEQKNSRTSYNIKVRSPYELSLKKEILSRTDSVQTKIRDKESSRKISSDLKPRSSSIASRNDLPDRRSSDMSISPLPESTVCTFETIKDEYPKNTTKPSLDQGSVSTKKADNGVKCQTDSTKKASNTLKCSGPRAKRPERGLSNYEQLLYLIANQDDSQKPTSEEVKLPDCGESKSNLDDEEQREMKKTDPFAEELQKFKENAFVSLHQPDNATSKESKEGSGKSVGFFKPKLSKKQRIEKRLAEINAAIERKRMNN